MLMKFSKLKSKEMIHLVLISVVLSISGILGTVRQLLSGGTPYESAVFVAYSLAGLLTTIFPIYSFTTIKSKFSKKWLLLKTQLIPKGEHLIGFLAFCDYLKELEIVVVIYGLKMDFVNLATISVPFLVSLTFTIVKLFLPGG